MTASTSYPSYIYFSLFIAAIFFKYMQKNFRNLFLSYSTLFGFNLKLMLKGENRKCSVLHYSLQREFLQQSISIEFSKLGQIRVSLKDVAASATYLRIINGCILKLPLFLHFLLSWNQVSILTEAMCLTGWTK